MNQPNTPQMPRFIIPPSGRVSYSTQYDMVRQLMADSGGSLGMLHAPVPAELVEGLIKEAEEALEIVKKTLEAVKTAEGHADLKAMTEAACAAATLSMLGMSINGTFGVPHDLIFQSMIVHQQSQLAKRPTDFPVPIAIIEEVRAQSVAAAKAREEQMQAANQQLQ